MGRTRFLLFSGLVVVSCLAPIAWAQSIKPGVEVKVHLVSQLDTGSAEEGQSFSATLAEPVNLGGRKILPRGTRIQGLVTETVSSKRRKRPASITLVLTSIDKTPVQTEALKIGGKPHLTDKQEIVLSSDTELDFVIASLSVPLQSATEPVVERTIDRAPESRPAIWHDSSREDNDDAYDALIFSDRDKWLIHSYFQSNYGNLPPGLAKRGGDLPPGLEKHLRRDETLPPDLQKRVEPLPAELERQLPRLPFGYSRVFLSGRVIVLSSEEQIVDVMFIYR